MMDLGLRTITTFRNINSPATNSGSVSNTGMDLEQDGFSGNSFKKCGATFFFI